MREVTEIGAFLLATLAKLQNPRVTFFGSKKKIIKKSIAFYFWPVRGENNLLSVLWLHVLQICTKKCVDDLKLLYWYFPNEENLITQ